MNLSSLPRVKRNGGDRPSVPCSSNLGDVIQINGKYWVVNSSNGVYFWDDHPRYKYFDYDVYLTHDNGGRPFCVYVEQNTKSTENKICDMLDEYTSYPVDLLRIVSEYATTKIVHIYGVNRNNSEISVDFRHGTHLKTYNVLKVFLGESYSYHGNNIIKDDNGAPVMIEPGNTILLQLKDRYMFIGEGFSEFTTDENEEIEEYYSWIGSSDTPRPIAVGTHNSYLMPRLYLSKKKFPPDIDWMTACWKWYKKREAKELPNYRLLHQEDYDFYF